MLPRRPADLRFGPRLWKDEPRGSSFSFFGPEKPMPTIRRLLALILLSVAASAPIRAGKPETKPDLPRVGEAREVRVAPEPSRFVREGSGRVWRETIDIPGAAFLKPRFSDFNLAPGDVLIVRSKSGRVVEE